MDKLVAEVDWEKVEGLLPAIIQDYRSSEVLMLGFMNQEALEESIKSGLVTFYSRTKQRLWQKGETSGNSLHIVSMSLDCDQDALLILVNPVGDTCHLERISCFEENSKETQWSFFSRLEQFLSKRKGGDPSQSYTASLYQQGTKRIAQKVGEEGVEVALAAAVNDRDEVVCEMADLLYHATILLHNQSLTWSDIIDKLKERNQA